MNTKKENGLKIASIVVVVLLSVYDIIAKIVEMVNTKANVLTAIFEFIAIAIILTAAIISSLSMVPLVGIIALLFYRYLAIARSTLANMLQGSFSFQNDLLQLFYLLLTIVLVALLILNFINTKVSIRKQKIKHYLPAIFLGLWLLIFKGEQTAVYYSIAILISTISALHITTGLLFISTFIIVPAEMGKFLYDNGPQNVTALQWASWILGLILFIYGCYYTIDCIIKKYKKNHVNHSPKTKEKKENKNDSSKQTKQKA